MALSSLLFFMLTFICRGDYVDDCPTSWGGEPSSGDHVYDGCAYDSSNAPSQMNISKIGTSDFTLSNSSFTNISHRVVFFNSTTRLSSLSFIQCVFDNISSRDYSGGGCMYLVYMASSNMPTCTITSCTFQACKSIDIAGAFYIRNILVDITDSRFYSCSSQTSGGAIYLDYWSLSDHSLVSPTTLRINNNDFASNTAQAYGGSLYLSYAGNISFVGNRFCGGKTQDKDYISVSGSDIMISDGFSGGRYETLCSDSSGCKVGYSAKIADPYRCSVGFLPSCSAENSQYACNPTAETCEERKPNTNRQTEKCGADCLLHTVSDSPDTCVSMECSDYDGTGHCPAKAAGVDCYLQPDGTQCKATCPAGYTANGGICVKNGNGEDGNDKNRSMGVSLAPVIIIAVVAVVIW